MQNWVILAADEARLKYEAGLTYIWYEKGQYPEIKLTRERKAKSFYGALDLQTYQETIHICKWQDSHQTVKFLKKITKKYSGKKILLLWDGAPWHRGEVKDYLRRKHHLEILYFPPYSPQLNPQEQVWKKTRTAVSHNHEEDFNILTSKFYNHLANNKFKSNFLKKYI